MTPRGPRWELVQAVRERLLGQPALKTLLGKSRHHLLAFELIEPELDVKTERIPPPPTRFRATIYDYTKNRTVVAEGRLSKPQVLELSQRTYLRGGKSRSNSIGSIPSRLVS